MSGKEKQGQNQEILGIDVSHWNGMIIWSHVAGAGIRFAMLKCVNEGLKPDQRFNYNYQSCIRQAIHVGAYKYVTATTLLAAFREVKAILSVLRGKKITYGVWLDVEDKRLAGLSAKEQIRLIGFMLLMLRLCGYTAGVYCCKSWYDKVFAPYKLPWLFWIARYPVKDDGEIHSKLDPGIGVCWQYSSKGKVEGIAGNVDRDLARMDLSKI